MKIKFSLFFALAASTIVLSPRAAHADLGYWSTTLVGTWKNPQSGDIYRFKSDATYTLTYAKPTADTIAGSSGYWKIVQPTEKESGGSQEGPVALLVKMRKIVFQSDDAKKVTRELNIERRVVVDTVGAPDAINRDLYRINRVNWKRVK